MLNGSMPLPASWIRFFTIVRRRTYSPQKFPTSLPSLERLFRRVTCAYRRSYPSNSIDTGYGILCHWT